jgi:MFS family permease
VLALALLGDSLLYAVLPLHAATFGISLSWAGVLLSANRITRLVVYSLLVRIATAAGLRRFTIGVAAAGAISTLAFAAGTGGSALLAARIAWGIAFGGLSLATLAYATVSSDGAGTRVGLSFALREVGPVVSLTAGVLLVTALGVRPALAILGAASMVAIPLAMLLPDRAIGPDQEPAAADRWRFQHPTHHEVLSAMVGLVADGIYPATLALLFAPTAGVSGAVVAAGTFLMLKRAAVVVLSPVTGRAAERFGENATTAAGTVGTAAGALLIACGSIIAGSALLVCSAAVTATSIPLTATSYDTHVRMRVLARLGLARDAGAAAGPLVAVALLGLAGTPVVYLFASLLLFGTVGSFVSAHANIRDHARDRQ